MSAQRIEPAEVRRMTDDEVQADIERWARQQVEKAPPWTPERVARLANALGYDVHTMSTDSGGSGT